jgi:lysozyme
MLGGMKTRLSIALLSLSAAGLAGIALHEGYRSRAYDDGVGVQTMGFGTTRHPDGRPVAPGDWVTPERALIMLAHDAARIEREIKMCIGDVPLHPHEWDAYVSLAYNIGPAAFCRSTLVKKLKADPPDYAGACAEILRWNKAGGGVLPGLVKRREAEYRRCMGGEGS